MVPVCLGGPGVPPPLSTYHSILLSFHLSASPGGLHHLIWINEEVDLRLAFSLALSHFCFTPPHQALQGGFFTQTPSTSASVSLHLNFRWNLFLSVHFLSLRFLSFSTFLPYLQSCNACYVSACLCLSCYADWQGGAVHSWDHLCILSHHSVWVVRPPSPQKTHSIDICDTHTHTYRNPPHHSPWISSREVCLCTSVDTHTQASCVLPNLWWVSHSNCPVNRCWARLEGADRGDAGIWLQNKGEAKLKASV